MCVSVCVCVYVCVCEEGDEVVVVGGGGDGGIDWMCERRVCVCE